MEKVKSIKELEALIARHEEARKAREGEIVISVCTGTGCRASGAMDVVAAFEEALDGLEGVRLEQMVRTGCHGFCERGPLVVIQPQGILYQRVRPRDVREILERTVLEGKVVKRLLYKDPNDRKKIYEKEQDIPFYKHQHRIVFELNGKIDPTRLEDYLAYGGYRALAKVLGGMSPEEVIDEITKSGLRGRGGAGFPTGWKWNFTRKAKGDKKYIVCNADEGDPGAFMDRSVLEGNPHLVIEGMIIGAYAIGADEGYIYVRNEYPMAVEHVTNAIRQAEELGVLGENILGIEGFNFRLKVSRGGGAFVCGEETALIASIEGDRGYPRPRPPYPAEKGLWGKPTNINNVETWANVPYIINRGADWYRRIGTGPVDGGPRDGSKGTKIFSLVGKVNNTGLVEVPMGMTLREIVEEIGGGVKDQRKGRKLKAVQTGGPSGGVIPEHLMDTPVDFEKLTELGSMMGSGGLIVMDDRTCMVQVAKYFVDFLKGESCGKCTPCREGLHHMSEILGRIVEGEGQEGDIEKLEQLAYTLRDASLCGLGQTAANPVLTTLKYYRHEYERHIKDKYCEAKQCTALIKYWIDPEYCTGCTICARNCPTGAISGELNKLHVIDQDKCVQCGVCYDVCNFDGAVKILSGKEIDEVLGGKDE